MFYYVLIQTIPLKILTRIGYQFLDIDFQLHEYYLAIVQVGNIFRTFLYIEDIGIDKIGKKYYILFTNSNNY